MITRVALKRGNDVFVGEQGWRHDKVILANLTDDHKNDIVGFVTDKGEFLNRKQAGRHAFECGQIEALTDCLLSEDVW